MDWSTQVDTAELRHHVVRLEAVDGKILGTGVSVAPGLVLTCAHVVKDGRTEVLVRPRTGDPRLGTVRARSADPAPGWRQPVWPFPDLAIIAYQGEPLGRYALLASQGFPGQQVDCIAWGYPERRDGVEPIGDPAAFRYTGVTDEDYLSLKGDVARPGLSGAPLVCPERRAVVGLVAATRGAQSPLGGWASPVSGLTHIDSPDALRSAGEALLAANVEAVLADRAAWHAVLPVSGAESSVIQSWDVYAKSKRANPADLLLADYGVVTYLFREQALKDAESWCLAPDPVAVATVSAVGGAGKTRFSVELCKLMAERHQWIAGEVDPADERGVATVPLPRLLVIDYAEAKAASDLQSMLERLLRSTAAMAPVRVILVTRERAGQVAVEASTVRAVKITATATLKRILDDRDANATAVDVLDRPQRKLLYDTAVRDFTAAWKSPEPTGSEPDLTPDEYEQPLPVLFEALDAVLNTDPEWKSTALEPDDPFWGPDPASRVLTHEEKYWRLSSPTERRSLLRQCVAVASLAGADSKAECDALLRCIPALESDDITTTTLRTQLVSWLADLYQGRSFVNPLRPDRLGEALVRIGFIAPHGADGLVRVLDSASLAQAARALTVLIRCSAQSPEAFDAIVETVARHHAKLAARLPEPDTSASGGADYAEYAEAVSRLLASPVGESAQKLLVPDERIQFARSLTRVGQAAAARYDYAFAQQLHRFALSIYTNLAPNAADEIRPEPETLDTLWVELTESRANLAYAYREAGNLGQAIPLYEENLTGRLRALGPDHPDTLTSRNNLAYAYESAGDLARAIPLFEQTLAIYVRVLGPDHPDTLTSRQNLAYAYASAGDLARAFPLFEQTLTDRERILGPDHPDTLTSRNNLAYAYQVAGDLTRAIPLIEQTLTDCERILGPDHPNTLTSRNNLAGAYRAAGDLTRAIPLIEQTLTDCERILGPDHPNTLTSRNNLAYAYRAAGDLTRAIPLYKQTLTDSERILSPDHPNTLTSRNNLAGAYESAGDLTRAIPLYEQTLTDSERILGPNHPITRTVRNNLNRARAALDRNSPTEPEDASNR